MTKPKAPGKSHRKGITLLDLARMFPDEQAAVAWFEQLVWNGHRCCGHCGSVGDQHRPQPEAHALLVHGLPILLQRPHRDRAGTIQGAAAQVGVCHLPRNHESQELWSSMKLHRDIGVTQSTAWFMLYRIRESWDDQNGHAFAGPVEVDETYFGGKGAQQARPQEAACGARASRQDRRPRGQGSEDESGNRPSHRAHRRPDVTGIRDRYRGQRRDGLHR